MGPLGSRGGPLWEGGWLGTTLSRVASGSASTDHPQASECRSRTGQQEMTFKQMAHSPQPRQQFLKVFLTIFCKAPSILLLVQTNKWKKIFEVNQENLTHYYIMFFKLLLIVLVVLMALFCSVRSPYLSEILIQIFIHRMM